jgi:hypothetical protein
MRGNAQNAANRLGRLERVKARRPDLERTLAVAAGECLDTLTAARRCGISVQALYKRSHRGAVIAIRTSSGRLVFPSFQFSSASVHSGIRRVIARLPMDDPREKLLFLVTATNMLGGRTPLDAIMGGKIKEVEAIARRVGKPPTGKLLTSTLKIQ